MKLTTDPVDWRSWRPACSPRRTLPAAAQAQTPKRGGTAVLVLGTDPLSLSPDTTNSVPDVGAGCLLHDALVRFGKGFEIVPSLAKSWEISKDGTVYRFDLVDAKWHDGKPVTSEDVKFTLEEISSKYGPRFNTAGKFIEKIDTPTPKHVIIKLKQPFGPFLFSLACEQNAAIMPAHILRGQDILKHPAILTQPVGAGPFRIKEWVRGSHIALERNPDYWRKDKGEPYLDRVMIKIMPDAAARVLALRAGEVDYVWPDYFPLSAVEQFQKDAKFTMREVSYPGSDIIILNTKNPQLAKREVRQALYTAIDRQFIHDKVFYRPGRHPAQRLRHPPVGLQQGHRLPEDVPVRPEEGGAAARRGRRQGRARRHALHHPPAVRNRQARMAAGRAVAAALLAGRRREGGAGRRRASRHPQARLQRLRLRGHVADLHDAR